MSKNAKHITVLFSLWIAVLGSMDLMAQQNRKAAANLLDGPNGQIDKSLQWMPAPPVIERTVKGIRVRAEKGTDYFIDPENGKQTATAPLLYRTVEGDFVATAKVRPDFGSQWNACALMLLIDRTNWIKLAFENSDATGRSVVSVVTREVSDDANGVVLEGREELWLRMIRKGDVYGLFWSADGKVFKMVRIARMKPSTTVKVGLEAQCPVGEQAVHELQFLSIENRTVGDLRKGE